jgi:hypothetical protein
VTITEGLDLTGPLQKGVYSLTCGSKSLFQVPNFLQRGSHWPHALALHQHPRVIEIIYAIQWRKSAD